MANKKKSITKQNSKTIPTMNSKNTQPAMPQIPGLPPGMQIPPHILQQMQQMQQSMGTQDNGLLEKIQNMDFSKLNEETKQKLDQMKDKLDKLKDKLLEKFDENLLGFLLLPPSTDDNQKEQINTLVLVDDTDSKKMNKEELKIRVTGIVSQFATEVDPNIKPETLLLSEVWGQCYDAKYDLLKLITNAAPIHDSGMIAALKLTELHKSMALQKFEKYIVSYVFAGSLVQGKATAQSDIDVFIVIDDTDVKKMTRVELKDKLRAIIFGMGLEAGKMTGIENKLNVQVYILTDFWDFMKEANPIIFTFLRDGIPLYDRGIFMPWKQLLQMGRIRPSPEAIDMMMHTGDQMMQRVEVKLKEIGMEDFFWATITTSQAAIMLYGLPPPTPKETPEILREIFVKKEKMLEDKQVKLVEKVLKTRKDMEHGTKTKITGEEIDELYNGSMEYLKKLKELFKDIQNLKENENYSKSLSDLKTIFESLLEMNGVEINTKSNLVELSKANLVQKAHMTSTELNELKEVLASEKDYKAGKLSKSDIMKLLKTSTKLQKFATEHIQRKRHKQLEKAKIRVRYQDTIGEIIMLTNKAFIIRNIDEPEKELRKATITKEGKLTNIQETSYAELEEAISKIDKHGHAFIKETLFEDLKTLFGKDLEILIHN